MATSESRLLAVLGLAGCFHPASEAACSVSCSTPSSSDECPAGTTCGSDMVCHVIGQDDCTQCFGGGDRLLPKVCFSSFASQRTIADPAYDTDSASSCDEVVSQTPLGPDLCVVSAADITTGTLTVVGSRPLVVIAQ